MTTEINSGTKVLVNFQGLNLGISGSIEQNIARILQDEGVLVGTVLQKIGAGDEISYGINIPLDYMDINVYDIPASRVTRSL